MSRGRRANAYRSQKRLLSGASRPPAGAKRPSRCPRCGLVVMDGGWRWPRGKPPGCLQERLCPACEQVRAGTPSGLVRFGGAFAVLHREGILHRIRNVERLAARDRPLERIIRIAETEETIAVTTTSEHLAARIAKAVESDFGGNLELRYAPHEKYATAVWVRDA